MPQTNIQNKMLTWALSCFLSSTSTSPLFCPCLVAWLKKAVFLQVKAVSPRPAAAAGTEIVSETIYL